MDGVMDTFSVYLFVREKSKSHPPIAIQRRLQALQALRDELTALGNVRVTALPHEADLEVEIRNVFVTNEGPVGRQGNEHRVLIVRLMIGDEPVEFLCADGIGNVPAEHHAAKRVLVWLYNLTEYHCRASRRLPSDLSVELCAN
jgi:hypothetical protein